MDFIEQIFGFNPDGGSGAFETALVLLAIGIVVLWLRARSRPAVRVGRDRR